MSRPRIEWTMRHGPVTRPLQAASCLFTTAAVADWTPLDPPLGWAAGAAAAGLGLVWWRSRRAGTPAPTLAFRCGTWAAGSGWLLYTLVNGIGTGATFSLAAGAVLAGAAVHPLHAREQLQAEVRLQQIRDRRLRALAVEWEERIRRICRIHVQVVGIERWIDRGADGRRRETGYTVDIELPDTGVGWETIAKNAGRLTNAARLPWGCEVQVTRGIDRLRVLLEVSTHNALGPVLPIPPAGPSTINDPIPLGVQRDGSEGVAPLRWSSWVIVGAVGSGKSNLLRTLINRLLECRDVLTVVIDPNGGGLAKPYLVPWLAGQIDRPPLLVVSTDEDAEYLVRFLQALIGARKESQDQAMTDIDDDKVPVSHRVPQIVVIADETHALSTRVQNGLVRVSNRGRGSSVRVVYTALRGTASDGNLPRPILAQGGVRIALPLNDAGELDYVFRDGPKPAITALEAGYGNIRLTGQPPFLIKVYRTVPSAAAECAIRTAPWRSEGIEPESLELISADLCEWWQSLWERDRYTLAGTASRTGGNRGTSGNRGTAPTGTKGTGGTRGTGGTGGTGGSESGRGNRRPTVGEALENLRRARERIRGAGHGEPPAGTSGTGDGTSGGTGGRFEDIVSGFQLPPELLVRLLDAFKETGAPQMHTADLEERIGAADGDLGRLLPLLKVYSLRNPFPYPGRDRARGYARTQIEEAADAIRNRRMPIPPAVAAWRSAHQPPDDTKDAP